MMALDSRPLVKPHRKARKLYKKNYRTKDIVEVVLEVERTDRDDTVELAKKFAPTYEGLRSLFYWCADHFQYDEDPPGRQWIQTPSYLYHTGVGDCKSFTVFISSVLHNMGLSRILAFSHYSRLPSDWKHVYPIAILPGGQRVPLDLAYYKQEGGIVGTEKKFRKKIEYIVNTKQGLYKLGTTVPGQQRQIPQVTSLADIEAAVSDIPDDIITAGPGDVTVMTSGQLDRHLMQERLIIEANQAPNENTRKKLITAVAVLEQGSLAGIGKTLPVAYIQKLATFLKKTANDKRRAFRPFTVSVQPVGISGGFLKKIGKGLKKVGKGIGKAAKKVGQAIGNAWKKLVNWIFKGPAKMMGAYFVFLWIKKGVRNKEARRRIAAQKKSYNWIRKTAKLDDGKFRQLMENGVKQQTGMTPAQLVNQAAGKRIGAVMATAVALGLKAIGIIIQVIKKISGLFKKNKSEAGTINEGNVSDLELLEGEAPGADTVIDADGEVRPDNSSGGLLVAAALGLGIMAFI